MSQESTTTTEQPRGHKRRNDDQAEEETVTKNKPMPKTREEARACEQKCEQQIWDLMEKRDEIDREIQKEREERSAMRQIRYDFEEKMRGDEERSLIQWKHEEIEKNEEELQKSREELDKMREDYEKESEDVEKAKALDAALEKLQEDCNTARKENEELKAQLKEKNDCEENLRSESHQQRIEQQDLLEKCSGMILGMNDNIDLSSKDHEFFPWEQARKKSKKAPKSRYEALQTPFHNPLGRPKTSIKWGSPAVEKLNSELRMIQVRRINVELEKVKAVLREEKIEKKKKALGALQVKNDGLRKALENEEKAKKLKKSIENGADHLILLNEFAKCLAGYESS